VRTFHAGLFLPEIDDNPLAEEVLTKCPKVLDWNRLEEWLWRAEQLRKTLQTGDKASPLGRVSPGRTDSNHSAT
jgi:hypothetical protein